MRSGSGEQSFVDDPALLARRMRKAIQQSLYRRHFKCIWPIRSWQPCPAQASGSGLLRLTLVIDGVRHLQLPSPDGMRLRPLSTGELILVHPSGWSRPQLQAYNRALFIDCYPNFTRFALRSFAADDSHPEDGAFHSSAAMSPAARGLQQSLLALIDIGDVARIEPVLHCFIDEILLDCCAWEQASQALMDWQSVVSLMHDQDDIELRRDLLAQRVGIHPNHLSRLCKKYTGQRLADYLTELRMQRACMFLRDTEMSIAAVAERAGYHDETHFRKRFKMVYGQTPSQWRKLQLVR